MKKLFNVAVMFAALATALSFSSCESDDTATEEVKEQQLDEIQAVVGEKVAFSSEVCDANGKNLSGYMKFTAVTGGEDQSVTLELDCDATSQKNVEIILSDKGFSYLAFMDGALKAIGKSDADANPDKVLFVLSNDGTDCTITSGDINNALSATGKVKDSWFAVKK